MIEEDEIDVLGDFSLDKFLLKSPNGIYDVPIMVSHNESILNCDCSSQWLLGHASSTNPICWYANGHSEFCTNLSQDDTQRSKKTEDHVDENQSSTDVIDTSSLTEKENDLLERGLDIFGKNNVRLSQFVGTKTASEVKHCYTTSTHTAKDPILNNTCSLDSDNVLNDNEIPANVEEVVTVANTFKPTIQWRPKESKNNSNLRSIKMETNCTNKKKRAKRRSYGEVKFKFSTKIKMPTNLKFRRKTEEEHVISKIKSKAIVVKSIPSLNREEMIKIKKEDINENSESDIEVDVENVEDYLPEKCNNIKTRVEQTSSSVDNSDPVTPKEYLNEAVEVICTEKKDILKDLSVIGNEVMQQLTNMEHPTSEFNLIQDSITDLEKYIHSEFFEGRPTKTSARYLKIRNHIINLWLQSKPLYVTKTSVRSGLKNCGDVNCIGRIHQLLEQIGAINFGCGNEPITSEIVEAFATTNTRKKLSPAGLIAQTNYIRPLYDILVVNTSPPKEKTNKIISVSPARSLSSSRPRIKKKFNNDGEGGCTLTHDEKGDVINTTVVNEEPVIKQKPHQKNPVIKLIYCKPFTEDHAQQYSINLHLSALLLMDLHAHMSHSEVMGLIGGFWNSKTKTLVISRYIPCKNIAPSATHCDMCPISQAEASDIIHGEGLNILGWFHTHPTFAPEPSQQDLDTQLSVQQWIGINKPCIGLILSPFSIHGALIASPYRCLIVNRKTNHKDQYVPYKFKVNLLSSNLDVDHLLNQAWKIFDSDSNVNMADRVDFNKPYFLDPSIMYIDKFISSVKMNLAKCSDINKITCDTIIQGFTNICCNHL